METATKKQPQQELTSNDVAICVSGLSKRYLIGGKKKGTLTETMAGMIGAKNNRKEEFWALQDINFEVKKGEVIGIIGKNGAGKSTLLKILSRITQPTSGKIEINGRVASLLEVGTGFHPELTGRENIYLNGTILGMSRQEVKDKFEEIVEFSGVRKFIDTPVKHYSSGMYVRLAFAVAAHLEPEILIIDEVLAVGDADFQKKCLGKMKEVAGEGRTVLFVSHNMTAIRSLCTETIYIQNGSIDFFGPTNKALELYMLNSRERRFLEINEFTSCETIKIHSIRANNNKSKTLKIEDSLNVSVTISILKETSCDYNFNLFFNDGNNNVYFALTSIPQIFPIGTYHLEYTLPANFLNNIYYSIDIMVIENKSKVIWTRQNLIGFTPEENKRTGAYMGRYPGVIRPNFIKPTILRDNE